MGTPRPRRYEKDPTITLNRGMKVISHETDHAFGIRHCLQFHYLMNDPNYLNETDRAPLHFYPAYIRLIHPGLNFDPTVRYQKLATLLNHHKMTGKAGGSKSELRKSIPLPRANRN